MTSVGKPHRAYTLLKAGRGQPARPMVARRPLFNYWAILMPHFRGVLLPPQNRSDESIQWTWTETADGDAVSAAELATIRKRLAGARQSLADSLEDVSEAAAKVATLRETKSRMDDVVGALVALPDTALAGFVARTDRGMLLHSWGLANPLPVQYLDADFELAGHVVVAGKRASGYEVILKASAGADVARTITDAEGRFEFSKVVAGSYRICALSRPPAVLFSEKGVVVELLGSSVTSLEIRNEDPVRNPAPASDEASSGYRLRVIVAVGAGLMAVAVYCFWPGKTVAATSAVGRKPSAWAVNSAPRSVARHSSESPAEPKGRVAQTAINANVAAQQTPKTSGLRRPPSGSLPEEGRSQAADIIVAPASSGLPAEQTGMPAGVGGIPAGLPGAGAGAAPGGGQGGGHSTSVSGGNASGALAGGAGGASASGSPAGAPSSSPAQAVSSAAPPNMPPAASRPQGSPAQKNPPPNVAGSKTTKAESPNSADPDSRPAHDLREVPAADVSVPAKVVASAEKNSAVPSAEGRVPASDLPDSDAPGPEETSDKKERETADVFLREGDDEQSHLQVANMPEQAGSTNPDSDSTLGLRTAFHLSPWRRLLLRDVIVPTLPTRAGQDEALSTLSSRVLVEKEASVPRTLRGGGIVMGVRIEFSASAAGASPHWDVVSGITPLVVFVDENAAEIGWSEEVPLGQYVLTSAGRVLASISTDPQGGIRVSSAGMISSWPWLGIECAPGEAGRFDWQAIGTAAVPLSWTKNHHWMNDRGRRLDLRLPAEKEETVVLSLAIVDASTGWARVSKIEQQQKLHR